MKQTRQAQQAQQTQTGATYFEEAPSWATRSLPKDVALGAAPSVLVVNVHEEGCWIVASRVVSDVVANPNSHLGNFMRSSCALLAMRHLSNN